MDTITNNINLTDEQIESLYTGVAKRFRLEEQAREQEQHEGAILPPEIFEKMENSSKNDLAYNLKRVGKDVRKYEGGDWTTSETLNKSVVPDLKRHNVDTFQVVTAKYKDADQLRTSGHGIAEIYETHKFAAERGRDPSDEDILLECIEKLRRLAIYAYATAKQIDTEARSTVRKALQLPDSVKHITEEDDPEKKLTFDTEFIERVNKARYEDAILRAASGKQNSSYNGKLPNSNNNRGQGRLIFWPEQIIEPKPTAEPPRQQQPRQQQQQQQQQQLPVQQLPIAHINQTQTPISLGN
jgi:hypothetical protein